jgi:S-(hydroxymethyl)glutathione dehydrogenase/alcohol dehydrogenase
VKTPAAVLWEIGGDWTVEECELDPPQEGEVLVRWEASGLCHSDEHLVTGDLPMPMPVVGGHEGAGVVEEVGAGVTRLQVGDHVASSFLPACGRCRMCVSGHSNLCTGGASTLAGPAPDRARIHVKGQDPAVFCGTATFARRMTLSEQSLVPILPDLPFDKACLVACGVTTGWGSVVHRGRVAPGETVVVVGVGGVGSAAVQGARMGGASRIVAVDPVPFKREQAKLFGATHVAENIDEAFGLVRDVTWGEMADIVVCTMGVGDGQLMGSIVRLAGKRGRVVVTNIHPVMETTIDLSMGDVLLYEKEILGSLFGSGNPGNDIPALLRMYRDGQLDLDGMITRTYPLADINQGYQDMRDGKNIRGVILHSD